MDRSQRFPASSGTPLFPVSPERANQQRQPPYDLPTSPSLPDLSSVKNLKASSDVQGRVAQFNSMGKEATERRKAHDAALKRAVLGREEAEGDTRRAREDIRALKKEIAEGQERERRVSERLEAIVDELQRAKDTHNRSQSLYEKEARRARKEAFRSSSALVGLQEELKSTRESLRLTQSDLELQKVKVGRREQEAFTAQYQLVGVQEELVKAQEIVKVLQEERDALKTTLKEEEVARIAAEGRIALPSQRGANKSPSPRKPRATLLKRLELAAKKIDKDLDEVADLSKNLKHEKRRRGQADKLVEFMKLECQFQCCSCRVAERQGSVYESHRGFVEVADSKEGEVAHADNTLQSITPSKRLFQELSFSEQASAHTRQGTQYDPERNDTEPLIRFSPTTGTIKTIVTAPQFEQLGPSGKLLLDDVFSDVRPQLDHTASAPLIENPPSFCIADVPCRAEGGSEMKSVPPTPPRHRTFTTTTTVPLAGAFTPSTMSREKALEQIRQRRGRARSIAAGSATPRRPILEGVTRRDISAPSIKSYHGGSQDGRPHQ